MARKKGRRSAARATAPRAAAAPRRRSRPDPPTAVLALAGVALTAYLTAVAWLGDHPAYCSAGSSCDLVQSSRWSAFLGLPVAAWGLLVYAILARLAWGLRQRPGTWRLAFVVASVGFAISAYLTAVSALVIEAVCAYCLASFAILTALLVRVATCRPDALAGRIWRSEAPAAAALGVIVVVGMHLHYSGVFDPAAGPEKPALRALATHLADSGALFYGAYWCTRCKEQKELFEASADRLPYVECTPSGRSGPENTACVVKGIRDYPTWIIGGRRYVGVHGLRELARLSGFADAAMLPKAPPRR